MLIRAIPILLLTLSPISSIIFNLPNRGEKCLKDEAKKDDLITGTYDIAFEGENKNLIYSIKISDSKNHILYNKDESDSGKFAFTLDSRDFINICFQSKIRENIPWQEHEKLKKGNSQVTLDLKRGIDAKNYDEVGKAEQLKPLEIQMRRLEDLSFSIFNGFSDMKKREEEMRSTNESTNARVLYFSIFSMACLIVLAFWQVMYLKKYFKTKKLID